MKYLAPIALFALAFLGGFSLAKEVYGGPYYYYGPARMVGAAANFRKVYVVRSVRDLKWVVKNGDDDDLVTAFPPSGSMPEDVKSEK